MQLNKENVIHWIRTNRTRERLSEQIYLNTPFGSPIKLMAENKVYRVMSDEIRVKCGHISFICDRKELSIWE